MTLSNRAVSRLGRGFVILAPPQAGLPPFGQIVDDQVEHERLLAEIQTLRGNVYLDEGAIQPDQVHSSGRYIQPADDLSWHLLTVDEKGQVTAGIRYLAHRPDISFFELALSGAISHLPHPFRQHVRGAVQSELAKADSLGFNYVELGGWVVGETLRCSTEAIRMLSMMYAFSQLTGGAIALSTATTRHNSAAILRRTGGRSLEFEGDEVPPYYDPHYDCNMEVLCFDSRFPNPRYAGWICEFREALFHIPIVSRSMAAPEPSSLLRLHSAVTGSSETRHPIEVSEGAGNNDMVLSE
jgi:hypothetical protein